MGHVRGDSRYSDGRPKIWVVFLNRQKSATNKCIRDLLFFRTFSWGLHSRGAVAEWVRALALNEWRPDILPGRVRLPLRATLSSELWQFR